MSSVPARQHTGSEAVQLSLDVPIRRLGVREPWEQLHHSDTLKDLLEELALWTAPWTGFGLSRPLSSRNRGAEWSR